MVCSGFIHALQTRIRETQYRRYIKDAQQLATESGVYKIRALPQKGNVALMTFQKQTEA